MAKKRAHLLHHSQLFKPKSEGGLGVRSTEQVNQSPLSSKFGDSFQHIKLSAFFTNAGQICGFYKEGANQGTV